MRSLASTILAAALSLPLCAAAQDVPQDAETLLRDAYALRRDGHDEQAVPLLEQAYTRDGSPRVAAQLGLGLLAVSRWTDADRYLREALAAPSDPWVARHLDGIEGAYSLVMAHLPRPIAPPPVERVVTTRIEHTTVRVLPAVTHVTRVTQAFPVRAVGTVAMAAGAVLMVGGGVAWGARELVVDGFNGRGCHIGDPMLPASCDVDATRSSRDIATALTVTGFVTGAGLAAVGIALLVAGHPQAERHAAVDCGSGPGVVGLQCSVRF